MKTKFDKEKRRMRWIFVGAAASVLFTAVTLPSVVEFVLTATNLLTPEIKESYWLIFTVIFGLASIVIGTVLSFLTGKFFLKPIDRLLDGMDRLSEGRYDTRVDPGAVRPISDVANSFNALAEELESTEILRSDFVNNFSHEFKTPIASIKGLASLMKSEKVTREKQLEYLDIITEETDRLSMMTTNVLNLSKIENQQILVNKSTYNLSEQIRSCILMFERQWSEKELHLSMDFAEYRICASEDMLKQVWLNLIDNAVKFSSKGAELSVNIEKADGYITVSIGNTAAPIPEGERERIFHKFHRAESEISRPGNGIGLSLVKSISELHGGEVSVDYRGGKNVFSVKLPE